MQQRVIAYVDGFNLYFGLRSRGWKRYYWLDLVAFSRSLLKPHQTLVMTKYFTSRIADPPDKRIRQSDYLEALSTLPDFRVHYGHYLTSERICRNCGFRTQVPTEKMTDVNIAVELLRDAFQDAMDTVILVSADSDLIAPLATVRELFPLKRLVVAFPPGRKSINLARLAHGFIRVGEDKLRQNQLPNEVRRQDGHVLHRPTRWV